MAGILIGLCIGAAMLFVTRSFPVEMQGSVGIFIGWNTMWLLSWWADPTDPG
jgi:hypothetical protein